MMVRMVLQVAADDMRLLSDRMDGTVSFKIEEDVFGLIQQLSEELYIPT